MIDSNQTAANTMDTEMRPVLSVEQSVLSGASVVNLVNDIASGAKYEDLPDHVSDINPEDLQIMMSYFGVDNEGALSGDFLEHSKFLYGLAQQSNTPIYTLLADLGSRVGGRFSSNFLEKVVAYARVLENEKNAMQTLMSINKERQSYES